jgi:hypothetical protein
METGGVNIVSLKPGDSLYAEPGANAVYTNNTGKIITIGGTDASTQSDASDGFTYVLIDIGPNSDPAIQALGFDALYSQWEKTIDSNTGKPVTDTDDGKDASNSGKTTGSGNGILGWLKKNYTDGTSSTFKWCFWIIVGAITLFLLSRLFGGSKTVNIKLSK